MIVEFVISNGIGTDDIVLLKNIQNSPRVYFYDILTSLFILLYDDERSFFEFVHFSSSLLNFLFLCIFLRCLTFCVFYCELYFCSKKTIKVFSKGCWVEDSYLIANVRKYNYTAYVREEERIFPYNIFFDIENWMILFIWNIHEKI